MVESNSESGEETGSGEITNKDKRQGIRREPSFSGWCDEDGIPRPARLTNEEVNEDDFDFELPLVQPHRPENKVLDGERFRSSNFRRTMEHEGDIDGASTNGLRNQNESYVPFDIENDLDTERYTSTTNGLNHVDYNHKSRKNAENPISVADVLKTLFFILVWYTFSTFLTLYNKTLLGDDMGKFPAPLLMNTFHFTMQAVLSKAITWFWSDRFHPSVMSWKDYFVRVSLTPLTTNATDGLCLSQLYQRPSALQWIVNRRHQYFSFFLPLLSGGERDIVTVAVGQAMAKDRLDLICCRKKLESPSVKLLGIILVISIGILLTVAKETEFEFWGFVFVTLAAVMSGFRWTMTQILLQDDCRVVVTEPIAAEFVCGHFLLGSGYDDSIRADPKSTIGVGGLVGCILGLKNPLTLMSYVTPVMAIATAILSLIWDPWYEFRKSDYFNSSWHIARSCLLMLFGGTLAFFMVLTEYILVSVTSAVTVTIAGVVKEAVTILVAVLYFHDEFTWLKGFGLLTIMVGVSLFNLYKYQKLQKGETTAGLPIDGATSKYVILDEMDEEEDGP
ncbi:hypothetical protein DH2020_011776 [Rehmannia glutinosa]|uniref:Sugar phosphate transporter domain-containing protein n=1 Tax=Rehmannia glutinosa TaxID=99300 RepID=A0ABR0XEY7_REHGL